MTPAPWTPDAVSAMETQPERTRLAWQRTSFAMLGVAALLISAALRGQRIGAAVLAAVVAVLGLGLGLVVTPRRYRRARRAVADGSDLREPELAAQTVVAVVVVATAVLVELLLHEITSGD